MRAIRHYGMTAKVLDYLKRGERLTAIKAAEMWNELNVRNKISRLRGEGWPIRSKEYPSGRGGVYKEYYLDPDTSLWPKPEEGAA